MVSGRYQPGNMVEKLWGRGRFVFGTEVGSPEVLVERTAQALAAARAREVLDLN